ncbi:MAG TPA: hypothetical protein VJY41_12985 [Prolixibacteraceae bacterium]|nr:hypothetical protein [Prolixibacteraceae bacterium]
MKQIMLILLLIVVPMLEPFAQIRSKNVVEFETNKGLNGKKLEIAFNKGKKFKDPTFAIWIEDMEGKYIETLYVTQYLGSGIYRHAKRAEGRPLSKSGPAKRPSTLPVWLHQRNNGTSLLPTPDAPVLDAISGATPKNSFILNTASTQKLPAQFKVMFEINQPFDYNKHWTKEIYPAEFDYNYSAQPALVYAAVIDNSKKSDKVQFELIGHSHYSGRNGELYSDVSSFTTALSIVEKIFVVVKD